MSAHVRGGPFEELSDVDSIATDTTRDPNENEDGIYTVEKILYDTYNDKTNRQEFLVKWLGYPLAESSFEPIEHFGEHTGPLDDYAAQKRLVAEMKVDPFDIEAFYHLADNWEQQRQEKQRRRRAKRRRLGIPAPPSPSTDVDIDDVQAPLEGDATIGDGDGNPAATSSDIMRLALKSGKKPKKRSSITAAAGRDATSGSDSSTGRLTFREQWRSNAGNGGKAKTASDEKKTERQSDGKAAQKTQVQPWSGMHRTGSAPGIPQAAQSVVPTPSFETLSTATPSRTGPAAIRTKKSTTTNIFANWGKSTKSRMQAVARPQVRQNVSNATEFRNLQHRRNTQLKRGLELPPQIDALPTVDPKTGRLSTVPAPPLTSPTRPLVNALPTVDRQTSGKSMVPAPSVGSATRPLATPRKVAKTVAESGDVHPAYRIRSSPPKKARSRSPEPVSRPTPVATRPGLDRTTSMNASEARDAKKKPIPAEAVHRNRKSQVQRLRAEASSPPPRQAHTISKTVPKGPQQAVSRPTPAAPRPGLGGAASVNISKVPKAPKQPTRADEAPRRRPSKSQRSRARSPSPPPRQVQTISESVPKGPRHTVGNTIQTTRSQRRTCPFWLKGNCKYSSSSCKYDHSNEIAPTCSLWRLGTCRKPDGYCEFSHFETPMTAAQSPDRTVETAAPIHQRKDPAQRHSMASEMKPPGPLVGQTTSTRPEIELPLRVSTSSVHGPEISGDGKDYKPPPLSSSEEYSHLLGLVDGPLARSRVAEPISLGVQRASRLAQLIIDGKVGRLTHTVGFDVRLEFGRREHAAKFKLLTGQENPKQSFMIDNYLSMYDVLLTWQSSAPWSGWPFGALRNKPEDDEALKAVSISCLKSERAFVVDAKSYVFLVYPNRSKKWDSLKKITGDIDSNTLFNWCLLPPLAEESEDLLDRDGDITDMIDDEHIEEDHEDVENEAKEKVEHLLGLDTRVVVPNMARKKTHAFIIVPEKHKEEEYILCEMLHLANCVLYNADVSGTWRWFIKRHRHGGLVLVHRSVAIWDIPHLNVILSDRTATFTFFQFGLRQTGGREDYPKRDMILARDNLDPDNTRYQDPEYDSEHADAGIFAFDRLFPFPEATFIADDVIVHQPLLAAAVINRYLDRSKPKPPGGELHKLCFRPGIKEWMAKYAQGKFESEGDSRYWQVYAAISNLFPAEDVDPLNPPNPKDSARLVSIGEAYAPGHSPQYEVDPDGATDSIIGWFAAWGVRHSRAYGKFTIVYEPKDRTLATNDRGVKPPHMGADLRGWGTKYAHVNVVTPQQWMDSHPLRRK